MKSAGVLLAFLVAGAASPLLGATLTVEEASGRPGSLVNLQVRIEDAPDLGGFDVVLAYDPQAAEAVDAFPGPSLKDGLFRWNRSGPGRVLLTAGDVPPVPDGEAAFAVTFQLYAPEIEKSPVTVDLARAYRRRSPQPLEMTATDGALVFRTGPAAWVWIVAGLALLAVFGVLFRILQRRRLASFETMETPS